MPVSLDKTINLKADGNFEWSEEFSVTDKEVDKVNEEAAVIIENTNDINQKDSNYLYLIIAILLIVVSIMFVYIFKIKVLKK